MKLRILAILFAVLMTLSLVACNTPSSGGGTSATPDESTSGTPDAGTTGGSSDASHYPVTIPYGCKIVYKNRAENWLVLSIDKRGKIRYNIGVVRETAVPARQNGPTRSHRLTF